MNRKQLFRITASLLIIISALSVSAGGGGVRWKIIRVDANATFDYMTNSSLQVYDGLSRLAYGSDYLYYAAQDVSDDFQISIVDNHWGVGKYASLAIDPDNGYPRISYYDETNELLKYAEYREIPGLPVWNTSTIGNNGVMSALALDNTTDHLPHVVYVNIYGEIRHTWEECPSGSCHWHDEEVDLTVKSTGTNITLAIDNYNTIHIAYYDSLTVRLFYGIKYGGTWTTGYIYDAEWYYDGDYGMEPSLALDMNGYAAIAYLTEDSLRYVYDSESGWIFETIYDESGSGKYPDFPSLKLQDDDSTYPMISFIDGDDHIRLATYGGMDGCPGSSGEFDCLPKDSSSTYRTVTSLATSDASLRSMIYMDAETGALHLQHESASNTWDAHVIDFSYDTGLSASLAVNSDGPHIGYYDQDANTFKYAEFDKSDPGGCGNYGFNTWFRCDTVAVGAVFGSGDSAGIGYNYYPHVAYYNHYDPALMYATLNPTWSSVVIDDSTPDIGRYPSLAFSPATGYARIAYMDVTNGYLKYAEELPSPYLEGNCGPSGHWKCVDIEHISQDGFGISLALNPSGSPLISFVDGDDDQVKVARYVGSGGSCGYNAWNCELIAPGHLTGWGQTSIWADSSAGLILVSFHYSDEGTLMLATYSFGSGWVHETAVNYMDAGVENSITMAGNMPVIAFLDGRFNDLMVAYKVGGGTGNCGDGYTDNWYCETLDYSGSVGFSPSIKLSPSGSLYISYYDESNGDLKLAFQALPSFLPVIKKP